MMKKIFKMVTNVAYEALVLMALYLTIYFAGTIAEGELFYAMDHADFEDFAILMLMLAGTKITVYDIIMKVKKIRNWFNKNEVEG